MSACIHYPSRKGLHEANFRGIIGAVTEIIYTVSGVGTVSFTIDPSGYAANFDGVVQALEDLNLTISGVSGGGGSQIQAGSGIFFTASGTTTVINATVTSASGVVYTAGSGLYLVNGTDFNVNFNNVFQNSVSGHVFGQGSNTVSYSGNSVIISVPLAVVLHLQQLQSRVIQVQGITQVPCGLILKKGAYSFMPVETEFLTQTGIKQTPKLLQLNQKFPHPALV
jgi:hypothetical protein